MDLGDMIEQATAAAKNLSDDQIEQAKDFVDDKVDDKYDIILDKVAEQAEKFNN